MRLPGCNTLKPEPRYNASAEIDLARSLRLHRLKSPDGNDVIDALIRVLQAS